MIHEKIDGELFYDIMNNKVGEEIFNDDSEKSESVAVNLEKTEPVIDDSKNSEN